MMYKHSYNRPKRRRARSKSKSLAVPLTLLAFLYVLFILPHMITPALIAVGGAIAVILILLFFLVVFLRKKFYQASLSRPIRDTRYIPDKLRLEVLSRDQYRCCQCGSNAYLEL